MDDKLEKLYKNMWLIMSKYDKLLLDSKEDDFWDKFNYDCSRLIFLYKGTEEEKMYIDTLACVKVCYEIMIRFREEY